MHELVVYSYLYIIKISLMYPELTFTLELMSGMSSTALVLTLESLWSIDQITRLAIDLVRGLYIS